MFLKDTKNTNLLMGAGSEFRGSHFSVMTVSGTILIQQDISTVQTYQSTNIWKSNLNNKEGDES